MGSHEAEPKNRLRFIALLLSAIVGIVGFRLVEFQVVNADDINEISYAKREVQRTIESERGSILDANGEVLARTIYRYDINAAPNRVGPVFRNVEGVSIELSVGDIAQELAQILDMDVNEVFQALSGDSNYANLKKRVSAGVFQQIEALNIPWIYEDEISYRLYPSGAVAGNVVGFVDVDGYPLAGLERQYNTCLAGVDGQETFERSAQGMKIPSSAQLTKPPVEGGDLNLTIDSDLQYFSQQVLADAVTDQNAEYAVAVVIEVETGKLLVAAEAPSVDPNDPGLTPSEHRQSKIFQNAYEPGSTMKSITTAISLDTGDSNAYTQIVAEDTMRLPWGDTIDDSFNHDPRNLTPAGVLLISSNVGITKLAGDIDRQKRYDYLLDFGFGEASAVNFEGESSGLLRPASQWDGMTNLTTLFGQGLAVTPIQMAYAYQAIANDGLRLDPILVESCTRNGEQTMVPNQQSYRVLQADAARLTVDMMEKVVELGGVGSTAQIPGYRVAGKTGTAQIQSDDGSGYGDKFAISFFGMAPAEDPKYVVAVMVYKPEGAINSAGATPPFKSIMSQVLRHYRVPPSTTPSANIPTEWE